MTSSTLSEPALCSHDAHDRAHCKFCGLLSLKADPPSFTQSRSFPQVVQSAEVAIADGEAKLAELTQAIEALRAQQRSIQDIVSQHRYHLSPVGLLPDDILLLVFQQLAKLTDRLSPGPPPWTASAVCRRWRTVTLSYPLFWTRIAYIRPRNVYEDSVSVEAAAYCIGLQLERAGGNPLTLRVDFTGMRGTVLPTAVYASKTRLFKLLSGQIHRCSSLRLDGKGNDWISTPLPQLPFLEELTIDHGCWLETNMFQNALLLRSLILRRITIDRAFLLCWQKLRDLTLNTCHIHPASLLEILDSTPELMKLEINNTHETHDQEALSMPVVRLEKLSSLMMSFASKKGEDAVQVRQVLEHLRIPNLVSLWVDRADDTDFQVIRAVIKDSGNISISTILIQSPSCFGWDSTLDLLALLPSLTHFVIGPDLQMGMDSILIALTWPTPIKSAEDTPGSEDQSSEASLSKGICPKLSKIHLVEMPISSSVLQTLVLSRLLPDTSGPQHHHPRPSPLERITLSDPYILDADKFQEDPLLWLDQLAKDGRINL